MVNLFFLITLSLCIIYTFLFTMYTKDYLNPLILFYIPISTQYILYLIIYKNSYLLSSQTYLAMICGYGAFLFGFIAKYKMKFKIRNNTSKIKYSLSIHNLFYDLTTIFCYIGVVFGLIQMFQFGVTHISGSFYSSVRYHVNYGNGYNFITKYSVLLMNIICSYDILIKFKSKKRRIVNLIVLILLLILGTARTDIISSVMMLLYVYTLTYKNVSKKNIRKIKKKIFQVSILILIIFIGISKLTNKMGDEIFFLFSYIGYPIINFDQYISKLSGLTHGQQSFGLLSKILISLGVIEEVSLVENMPIRGEFNVFSYLADPYLDFGILGVFFISLTLGMFISYVYENNRIKKGRWTILYASFSGSVLLSFYAYTYDLTTYLYIIIYIFICIKKKKEGKEKEAIEYAEN